MSEQANVAMRRYVDMEGERGKVWWGRVTMLSGRSQVRTRVCRVQSDACGE